MFYSKLSSNELSLYQPPVCAPMSVENRRHVSSAQVGAPTLMAPICSEYGRGLWCPESWSLLHWKFLWHLYTLHYDRTFLYFFGKYPIYADSGVHWGIYVGIEVLQATLYPLLMQWNECWVMPHHIKSVSRIHHGDVQGTTWLVSWVLAIASVMMN